MYPFYTRVAAEAEAIAETEDQRASVDEIRDMAADALVDYSKPTRRGPNDKWINVNPNDSYPKEDFKK